MTNLFLHVGTHKTGSTAIQNLMHHNRKALQEKGFLYPDIAIEGSAHHPLAWACGLGGRKVDADFIGRTTRSLAAKASKLGCDVVLSSEEFGALHNILPLRRLSDLFNVKVVLYVRKQDHYLESVYNQHVRMYSLRYSGSIYQFFPRFNFFNQFNYNLLASRWEKHFGLESIIIRPFGTADVGADVRTDFLDTLGLPGSEHGLDLHPSASSNASLNATAISYLSHINRMPLDYRQHQKVLSVLPELVPADKGGRLLRLNDALALYSRFEPSNRRLFSRYMHLDHVPFDELLPADESRRWVSHEHIDTATLLDLVGHLLPKKTWRQLFSRSLK